MKLFYHYCSGLGIFFTIYSHYCLGLRIFVHKNFFTTAQDLQFFFIFLYQYLVFLHHTRFSCEGKQTDCPQKLYTLICIHWYYSFLCIHWYYSLMYTNDINILFINAIQIITIILTAIKILLVWIYFFKWLRSIFIFLRLIFICFIYFSLLFCILILYYIAFFKPRPFTEYKDKKMLGESL